VHDATHGSAARLDPRLAPVGSITDATGTGSMAVHLLPRNVSRSGPLHQSCAGAPWPRLHDLSSTATEARETRVTLNPHQIIERIANQHVSIAKSTPFPAPNSVSRVRFSFLRVGLGGEGGSVGSRGEPWSGVHRRSSWGQVVSGDWGPGRRGAGVASGSAGR
jgi:hypothetical protein